MHFCSLIMAFGIPDIVTKSCATFPLVKRPTGDSWTRQWPKRKCSVKTFHPDHAFLPSPPKPLTPQVSPCTQVSGPPLPTPPTPVASFPRWRHSLAWSHCRVFNTLTSRPSLLPHPRLSTNVCASQVSRGGDRGNSWESGITTGRDRGEWHQQQRVLQSVCGIILQKANCYNDNCEGKGECCVENACSVWVGLMTPGGMWGWCDHIMLCDTQNRHYRQFTISSNMNPSH